MFKEMGRMLLFVLFFLIGCVTTIIVACAVLCFLCCAGMLLLVCHATGREVPEAELRKCLDILFEFFDKMFEALNSVVDKTRQSPRISNSL